MLDVNGSQMELLRKIDRAIGACSNGWAQDHVSVYALDCSLVRSLTVLQESDELSRGVDEDLQSWVNRGRGGQKRACANPLNLWDALRFVTYELSNRPGRRMILAVTNGYDRAASILGMN